MGTIYRRRNAHSTFGNDFLMSSLPSWATRVTALLRMEGRHPQSRYISLATITKEGRPAVRTVVFRGFDEPQDKDGSLKLRIATDDRSEKVAELIAAPWAELCWYFEGAREQFRITGRAEVVCEGETNPMLKAARQEQWSALSARARAQFYGPAPGKVYDSEDTRSVLKEADGPGEPAPHFTLLVVTADAVDHLRLRQNDRYRYVSTEGVWKEERLNP